MKSLIYGDHMEMKKLDSACKEWGFFQLINHGVSSTLVENIKVETQQFFNQSMEDKKKFWMTSNCIEGFGQHNVLSDDQKLDWGDAFFLRTLPKHLRKPHLMPHLPLPFRDNLDAYSTELKHLAVKIIDIFGRNLEIRSEELTDLFGDGMQSMRMNYYPPCPRPEQVMGLTPHADIGALTILLQVNDTEGLQVKMNGVWVPIKPIPGAFVINIGDMLEIVTNGSYRSNEHRAVVNSNKERLSIATFYSGRLDGELGPAPSLITPQNSALYRKIGVREYLKGLVVKQLDGKSYIDIMKIKS